jgi:hypothetical protein
VTDAEPDVLGASVGTDRDGSWPASHAVLSRYPLLRILYQGEGQPQAPANFIERISVLAAVECGDEWRPALVGMQSLQAAQFRETRRRP